MEYMKKRSFRLMSRPFSEILLRNIIFNLYKDNYLNSNFSIIDIGSWIGDNDSYLGSKLK